MFFDIFDRADKNGDGKVDMWETAEALFEYDSIMGTNISGFCPENDRRNSDLYDEDEEGFNDEYEDEEEEDDEFEDEDEDSDEFDDEFDCEYDDSDEW